MEVFVDRFEHAVIFASPAIMSVQNNFGYERCLKSSLFGFQKTFVVRKRIVF